MSDSEATSLLSQLERERLSVYVGRRTKPSPRWVWPALGLGSATMLAVNDLGSWPLSMISVVLFAALLGGVTAKLTADNRVQLRLTGMPAPLLRVLMVYWALGGTFVLGGGLYVTLAMTHPLRFTFFGLAVGLVTGFGGWITVRLYEARAAQLAKEAGIRS